MGLLELAEHRTETQVTGAGPADLEAGTSLTMPSAIPSLIDAAVASFDADRLSRISSMSAWDTYLERSGSALVFLLFTTSGGGASSVHVR